MGHEENVHSIAEVTLEQKAFGNVKGESNVLTSKLFQDSYGQQGPRLSVAPVRDEKLSLQAGFSEQKAKEMAPTDKEVQDTLMFGPQTRGGYEYWLNRNFRLWDEDANGYLSQKELDGAKINTNGNRYDATMLMALKKDRSKIQNLHDDEIGFENDGVTMNDMLRLQAVHERRVPRETLTDQERAASFDFSMSLFDAERELEKKSALQIRIEQELPRRTLKNARPSSAEYQLENVSTKMTLGGEVLAVSQQRNERGDTTMTDQITGNVIRQSADGTDLLVSKRDGSEIYYNRQTGFEYERRGAKMYSRDSNGNQWEITGIDLRYKVANLIDTVKKKFD